jgi:hypothetical protein
MKVRTYTSDFERAEMNMLAEHFPKEIHVGCFFSLQASIGQVLEGPWNGIC